MAKNTSEIHELTSAEIARQIRMHSERRLQITNERASIYSSALKNGGATETPAVIDDDEKAARSHAKHLLNGAAPESLSSVESSITLDKKLYREQRGIDIALKILADKDLVARATEAVEWAEAHSDEWRQLVREIVITTIRLNALERRAGELLGGCGDIFAVRLPLVNVIGGRAISETPIGDLTETALAQGVVTSAEIRKAQNVS